LVLSVGATLEKLAKGEVHDLTRDELFGLTHRRFLREHRIDLAYADATTEFVQHAVRVRNSTHPHVKRLGLSPVMVSHNDALKSLYQDMVGKIVRHFEAHVRGKNTQISVADEGDADAFEVDDIEKQAFLANVAATLKQSKNPFNNLSVKYVREAYRAGHKSGGEKVVRALKATAPQIDTADENDVVSGYADSEGTYWDGLLDDIHDDVASSFEQPAATKDDFVTALASSLMGQFYRTDLFTSDLYRVGQDAQIKAFEQAEKDNAGAEWKYKWRAVVDHLTCDQCLELNDEPPKYLDEFEYDPGDVHFFCRCDLDPIPPDEDSEDGGEDGGGDGPDGEQPDLFEGNPNNDGLNTDLDAAERRDFGDVDYVPRDDNEAASLLATVTPEAMDTYVKETTFLDKVDDLKAGTVGGRKMKNLANLTTTHFSQKHDVNVEGAWSNREWWDRLRDTKKMKNELDMLARLDAHLDAFKGTKHFDELKQSGHVLRVSRDLNKPNNGGFYNLSTSTVHLHNGSLSASDEFKNRTVAHEMGHWLDYKMRVREGIRGNTGWKKFHDEWANATTIEPGAGHQRFVSEYGEQNFMKYRTKSPKERYDEDIADGVAAYIHTPGLFKGSPVLQRKYELLKEHVFDGREFPTSPVKPLF
jgi:hypothetical protein